MGSDLSACGAHGIELSEAVGREHPAFDALQKVAEMAYMFEAYENGEMYDETEILEFLEGFLDCDLCEMIFNKPYESIDGDDFDFLKNALHAMVTKIWNALNGFTHGILLSQGIKPPAGANLFGTGSSSERSFSSGDVLPESSIYGFGLYTEPWDYPAVDESWKRHARMHTWVMQW